MASRNQLATVTGQAQLEEDMANIHLDLPRGSEKTRDPIDVRAVLPVVETVQPRARFAEETMNQTANQQDTRMPWRGTVVPVRDIGVALEPVGARVDRRRKEVSLLVADIQNIAGRLQSVGTGLDSLGLIRDVNAAAKLIIKMRRNLVLGRSC